MLLLLALFSVLMCIANIVHLPITILYLNCAFHSIAASSKTVPAFCAVFPSEDQGTSPVNLPSAQAYQNDGKRKVRSKKKKGIITANVAGTKYEIGTVHILLKPRECLEPNMKYVL